MQWKLQLQMYYNVNRHSALHCHICDANKWWTQPPYATWSICFHFICHSCDICMSVCEYVRMWVRAYECMWHDRFFVACMHLSGARAFVQLSDAIAVAFLHLHLIPSFTRTNSFITPRPPYEDTEHVGVWMYWFFYILNLLLHDKVRTLGVSSSTCVLCRSSSRSVVTRPAAPRPWWIQNITTYIYLHIIFVSCGYFDSKKGIW